MENYDLETEKKRMSKAERAEAPGDDTFRIINYLTMMGDRIPAGTTLSGEVVRSLVDIAEKRGATIPGCKWTDIDKTERRNLQTKFNKIAADLPVPTPFKARTATNNYSDAELDRKIAKQIKQFNEMCERDEKAKDPLSILADKRAKVPARRLQKGTVSPEDQKLYNQFKAVIGRK
jgi:hypothetical protein